MITTHNLGFPRIGGARELKFALESFWKGESSEQALLQQGEELRQRHWQQQAQLDFIPAGDFSFYDQVLDMSFMLGAKPPRVVDLAGSELDNYFRIARGRSAKDTTGGVVHAGEMTKWFDTNYHYIVPEFTADTVFSLNPQRLLEQLAEATSQGINVKPVIIGPLTYLWLGKEKDASNKLDLLAALLPVYAELLDTLADAGAKWVQIDEPILVTELNVTWKQAFRLAYKQLENTQPKLLLTTYFGTLEDNLPLICELPVAGIHLDVVNAAEEVAPLIEKLPGDTIVSLGIVNGRNIWKTDLEYTLDWLEPIAQTLRDRLWIAPSCSLLHVPVDLNNEQQLDEDIKSWLAFAVQKLDEIALLARAVNEGRDAVKTQLASHAQQLASRRVSSRVHNPAVKKNLQAITAEAGQRHNPYAQRAEKQARILTLPVYPTTTIGSFPQTSEIRQCRLQFRQGKLDKDSYQARMKKEIAHAVQVQETLGLDVLVHGEAERNDMVEYFGEQLDGYAFSQFGWVQSYGSRCVKPPILFGDISRPKAMTVAWIKYAQSLTEKPMKGMLTGPVTILNWSFVRDDQPRSKTCCQLALAIREEVLDLEKAGIRIIQIDEAALREGLPLRKSQWKNYLSWAIEAFRITANGVSDETQIHTHMCYSEFNDIIQAIAAMDADVITIETSRSDMELLDVFEDFNYPNAIGPGVYDIHSPNIPSQQDIVQRMQKAAQRIPARRLWVNPDCGLKTRQWKEVIPALENMVKAAQILRRAEVTVTEL